MPVALVPLFEIAFAGTALEGGILGSSITAATLASYTVTTALTIGGGLLLNHQSSQHGDIQITIRQPTPARTRHYGYVKIGGSLYFFEGDSVLTEGILLGEGPFEEIHEVWLNDYKTNFPVGATFSAANCWPWNNHVTFDYQSGTPGQGPNPGISGPYSSWWDSSHRCAGIANIVMRCYKPSNATKNFSQTYPTGIPQVRVVVKASQIYDPRDGTQSQTDSTTWKWSNNPALAMLDYLTHWSGYALPYALIDVSTFIDFANLCDEPVALGAGGTEPRYRIDCSYSMDEQFSDVRKRILETCDGELYLTSGGLIGIRGGQWTEPTVTIDESMILSVPDAHQGAGILDEFNEVKIRYTDAVHNDFQLVECDPWIDTAAQAATGEKKVRDLPLVGVQSWTQARRLGKIFLLRGNPQWTLSLKTNYAALTAFGERTVFLNFPTLGINSGTFFVNKFIILDDATCQVDLVSMSASTYAWTTAEEGNAAATGEGTVATSAPAIENVTGLALSIERTTVSDSVIVPTIRATVTAPVDTSLSLHAQYRVQGSSTWLDMTDDQAWSAISGVANDNTTYEVQAAFSSGSVDGAFTGGTILVQADTTAPDVPTSFNATVSGSNVNLTWTTPNSPNFYATRVYRNTTATFASATLLGTVYNAPDTATGFVDVGVSSGTKYYWITAINSSSVASAAVGPDTVTV